MLKDAFRTKRTGSWQGPSGHTFPANGAEGILPPLDPQLLSIGYFIEPSYIGNTTARLLFRMPRHNQRLIYKIDLPQAGPVFLMVVSFPLPFVSGFQNATKF